MASWLVSSKIKEHINESRLLDEIKKLDINDVNLLTQAVAIDCNCSWDFEDCECACETIDQVECLDFAQIILRLTGGFITSESLIDMYSHIMFMLSSDNFDIPEEWDFCFTNRQVLITGSLINDSQEVKIIRGILFYPHELPFISKLLAHYICYRNPVILFYD
uniref:Uncharacterized protein n=1 Tax=Moumouvirus sp. 'Monve' TaxID=1128131 RepID=H2EFQ6_9VIRU|nr:hypothetical protein mv_R1119 [Moumouvirus Monve]